MFEQLSRVLGLDGLAVTAVREQADELDVEVELELVAVASSCRLCGGRVEVKERPRVRVRDLPLAGRRVTLVWRKRRFRCRRCRRSFSETHAELPTRQRVSARFRARLFARLRSGGAQLEVAREEQTSRYQVERAFRFGAARELAARPRPLARRLAIDEAAHRRGSKRLVTVVCDPDRRCVVEVLEGRDRRTLERFLGALPEEQRRALEAVSIDPAFAYRQALRTALPRASGQQRAAQRWLPPRAVALAAAAAERGRAALRARAAHTLRALPGRARAGRGLGAEGALPDDLPRPRPGGGRAAAGRLRGGRRAGGDPLLHRLRERPAQLARRAARLLRAAHHERLRRRSDQQDQGDQAPRLRTAKLRELPNTGPRSMRLTGSRGAPARSARARNCH